MKKLTLFIVLAFIIQVTASSQPCLPGGIYFNTQAEIDNFQTNYPNCTEIGGNVTINGGNITNLSGLNVLTAFGGDLDIMQSYDLTSLSGLGNVTSIGGSLWVAGTDALTSLTGLDNLTSIGGSLSIVDNAALISLTGLENITYIEGSLVIGLYMFGRNYSLASLTGLDGVTFIGGDLEINFTGSLTNLTGLDNLISIGGDLWICKNVVMTSLTGLENLTSIGGDLKIGLVTYPYGGNQSLTSLAGLDNVVSIGGEFEIYNNDALIDFSGLNNLTSIGGHLTIEDNENLNSLTGLDNIDPISIGNLDITYNPSLSTCEVQSICDYIADPMGIITINNNAVGCTNLNQVQQACEAIWVPEINFEPAISIYPNPAEKELSISGRNGAIIKEVNIYNQTGQRVLHENRLTGAIDISMLRQGMYIIEVVTNESKIKEKLIIK